MKMFFLNSQQIKQTDSATTPLDQDHLKKAVLNAYLPDTGAFPCPNQRLSETAKKEDVWVERIHADPDMKKSFDQAINFVVRASSYNQALSDVALYMSVVKKLPTPEARVACCMISCFYHGAQSVLGAECGKRIVAEADSLLFKKDRLNASAFGAVVCSVNGNHMDAMKALNDYRTRRTAEPRPFKLMESVISKALGL